MAGACPHCGAPLEERVCGYCGYSVEEPEPAGNAGPQIIQIVLNGAPPVAASSVTDSTLVQSYRSKSKPAALLLCIFLGYLGVHRFYAGKTKSGILYLLTGGLCGFGWIVDILLILAGSFRDAHGLSLT